MQYKLSELIEKFGGVLHGKDVTVSAIMPTDIALTGEITFFSDKKYAKELAICKASAIIICASDLDKVDIPAIICDDPYLYFAKVRVENMYLFEMQIFTILSAIVIYLFKCKNITISP